MRVDTIQKRSPWFWIAPEASITSPRERMRAVRRRKVMREMVKGLFRVRGGREERELAAEL
jgi:hypothetical protein